jgi:hypothetical protein
LLREHLERWCAEGLSVTSVRRQLHDLGYVWKRRQPGPCPQKGTHRAHHVTRPGRGPAPRPISPSRLHDRPLCLEDEGIRSRLGHSLR